MAKTTPNIGLHLTTLAENDKLFINFRDEIAGDSETSNMMVIDREIGDLKTKIETTVIWSEDEPESQESGDTWNQIIS